MLRFFVNIERAYAAAAEKSILVALIFIMKYKLILLLLLVISGCKSKEPENITVLEEDPVRYLALGDSYTIGESVAVPMRWPMQLAEGLREEGIAIEEPRIIARTGWTTGELLEAMEIQLNNEKFDLVSVSIGVNNQFRGLSPKDYENDLHEIFRRALQHSEPGAAGVFALSIPDYGVTPFGAGNEEKIGRELDEFNRIFRKVAEEYGVDFYDITPISRRAKENSSLIADDDLHPSGKMYSLWVELILGEILQKLETDK